MPYPHPMMPSGAAPMMFPPGMMPPPHGQGFGMPPMHPMQGGAGGFPAGPMPMFPGAAPLPPAPGGRRSRPSSANAAKPFTPMIIPTTTTMPSPEQVMSQFAHMEPKQAREFQNNYLQMYQSMQNYQQWHASNQQLHGMPLPSHNKEAAAAASPLQENDSGLKQGIDPDVGEY